MCVCQIWVVWCRVCFQISVDLRAFGLGGRDEGCWLSHCWRGCIVFLVCCVRVQGGGNFVPVVVVSLLFVFVTWLVMGGDVNSFVALTSMLWRVVMCGWTVVFRM